MDASPYNPPPPQWMVYCSVCVCVCVCVCIIRIDFVPKRKVFGAQHELELAEKHQQGRPVYSSAKHSTSFEVASWECIINELFGC